MPFLSLNVLHRRRGPSPFHKHMGNVEACGTMECGAPTIIDELELQQPRFFLVPQAGFEFNDLVWQE